MIDFISLGHDVFNPHSDLVVDHLYQYMIKGPVVWLEEENNIDKVSMWCSSLYPRRLLLHAPYDPKETLQRGMLYVTSYTSLTHNFPMAILCSRGHPIPPDVPSIMIVHWVDDDREQNRASYRTYQQRGYKPNTIHLNRS